jgi:hypothetical protein
MSQPRTTPPNPRRVAAGRLNRQKRGPLTPAGRERLRQTALRFRPWRFSTGPKTAAGKLAAARNGKKSQRHAVSVSEQRALRKDVERMLAAMAGCRQAAVPADEPAAG